MIRQLVSVFCFSLILFATAATRTNAQFCFGDDGFAIPGACCVPTTPNLPPFPQVVIPSEGCCFLNCNVEAVWNCNIAIGAPIPIYCDLYVAPMTIFSSVTPTQTSFLVMKYARTWEEFNPVAIRQVWRFLINTDLTYAINGPNPCPIPSCTSAYSQVHFLGSLDYALDCFNGTIDAAINLTHFCEAFSHSPSSQRPATGAAAHPERSFAFVGPAPFNFGQAPVPFGNISGDAQRSTAAFLPGVWNCMSETAISGGFMMPIPAFCPCADPSQGPVGSLFTDYAMGFSYGCALPSAFNFQPIPIPGLLNSGMTSMSLGTYAGSPLSFPGTRSVHTWFGVASAPDPCASSFNLPFHIVTGVTTLGGDVGRTFPNPFGQVSFTDQFTDLCNMNVFNPNVPGFLFLGYGSIYLPTQVWGLNTP